MTPHERAIRVRKVAAAIEETFAYHDGSFGTIREHRTQLAELAVDVLDEHAEIPADWQTGTDYGRRLAGPEKPSNVLPLVKRERWRPST